MFFEMLTGACPFRGSNLSILRKHLTEAPPVLPAPMLGAIEPGLSEVIARLLAKDPGARFQTASDLLAAIDESTARVSAASFASSEPRMAPATPSVETGTKAKGVERGVRSPFFPLPGRAWVWALGVGAMGAIVAASVAFFSPSTGRLPVASASAGRSSFLPPPEPQGSTSLGTTPSTEVPDEEAAPTLPEPSPSAAPSATGEGRAGSSRAPASRPSRGRKTGPGGIYIPPPKDWFK